MEREKQELKVEHSTNAMDDEQVGRGRIGMEFASTSCCAEIDQPHVVAFSELLSNRITCLGQSRHGRQSREELLV